ncbi:MAG: HIT domain-containing protein [Bradyrhizobiaceae bacterium]|nr:HIT domain-containing protein [Bradyrhizobiaceae bacterium]
MTAQEFVLDPRLAAETVVLGELGLCRVLLVDDARFPWLILVPRRAGLVEIIDLAAGDLVRLIEEIATASGVLEAATSPHKLNVAALGNVVRQLHVHIVARFENDATWPNPVWGGGERQPYAPVARAEFAGKLRAGFGFG